ncbi:MAG: tetratricopeptide repeat protein [bacterium]|nr:tetratricopeptide repeat protein [bacterium]
MLALVFIIPVAWFPFQLAKVAVFGLCLLVSAGLFTLGGGLRMFSNTSKGTKTALLVAALPLVYLVSWYFSASPSVGLSGFSVEADTIVFITLASLAFVLSFALFRSTSSARILLAGVVGVAAVVALFQYIVIVFGTSALPLAAFADRSVNLVGKWNDLGLLVGLGLLLLLVWVEFVEMPFIRRVYAGVVALLLVLLLAIVQFSLVWLLLLGSCLLLSVWSFLSKPARPSGQGHSGGPSKTASTKSAVPWLPLAGAAVAGLLLLWGSILGGGIASVFPVSSLEVRPSFSSTIDVVKASHGASLQKFFVGTGPNTFGQNWLLNKPKGVNQSQFWNLDFNVGFSTFMTALVSVGVLGVLAWLVPLALVLLGALRVARTALFSAKEKVLGLSLCLAGVYLWCVIFLYVPSENIVLLAFVLAGAAFGFSLRHPQVTHDDVPVAPTRAARLRFGVIAAVSLLLILSVSATVARRALAEAYTNQGLAALAQQNADQALASAARAQSIEVTGNDLLLATAAGTRKLQQMAASTAAPSKEQQTAFTEQLKATIASVERYIVMNPQDYRGYLLLANIYNFLTSLGVQDAYDTAGQKYKTATQYNPMNPEIPLVQARLEVTNKNNKDAEKYVMQALTLKPDYTDAILFVVQLNVANKDLVGATRAAQAAVQSAPGVPSIWFELGLLYYTQGDMQNALSALEQAIKIEPNYANAKYFLGLSYAAQGRTQDAIRQFIDLQKTNPDNSEVASILQNLEQGKKPFDNAQPPVSTAPQKRTTAPISQ